MSTTTKFDDALDFMPAPVTSGRGRFTAIRTFFRAISEGVEAQAAYQRNLARGMTSTDAAAKAFEATFKDR